MVMSDLLSHSCIQYLMFFCTMLFGVACSALVIVGTLYLGVRLVAFILREIELYKYRRASVRLRKAEAAQAEAGLYSPISE